jgi:hypothetical protein
MLRPVLAALAAGLALGAAACGGDDGGDDGGGAAVDAEAYAAQTCEVALLWAGAQEQLTGLEQGNVEAADAEQAVVDAQAKTTVYIGAIRGLEEPLEAEPAAAHASLLATADSLEEHSDAIKAEGQPLAAGDVTPQQAAADVLPQIDGIFADLRESVSQLDAIATDVDVTAIVRDDQSCRALDLS